MKKRAKKKRLKKQPRRQKKVDLPPRTLYNNSMTSTKNIFITLLFLFASLNLSADSRPLTDLETFQKNIITVEDDPGFVDECVWSIECGTLDKHYSCSNICTVR